MPSENRATSSAEALPVSPARTRRLRGTTSFR